MILSAEAITRAIRGGEDVFLSQETERRLRKSSVSPRKKRKKDARPSVRPLARSPAGNERASERSIRRIDNARATRASTLYRMTPVKCRGSPVRRLSDEACKELGYTRTHTRGPRRCGRTHTILREISRQIHTCVRRSTIITIGSAKEEKEEEAGGWLHPPPPSRERDGLAGNRYIHTRNRVTLPVHSHAGHTYTRGLMVHTRGAAGAHRLTGLHK